MPDSRIRDHIEEIVARARLREPDPGEVARALFAEHLDLDAIRRALGQRAAPVTGGRAEAGIGEGRVDVRADAPPEAPPLGRELSFVPRIEAPREVMLAALAGDARPVSRRMAVPAPARLGAIVAVAMMLEIGAPGIPGWPGGEGPRANPPAAPMQMVPPPPHAVSPAPELGLARSLAPVSFGDGVRPSPVPVIRASAGADALSVPDQPAVPLASVAPPRILALVGGIHLVPSDLTRRPDLAPIRFVASADLPTASPSAPKRLSERRADAAPVLVRGTMDETAAAPVDKRPVERIVAANPAPSAPWTSRAVVHLHRAAGGAFRARLAQALRRAGFDRVEWRAVADTVSRTQTRYFHPGDAGASERAAAVLAAQGRPAGARDFTHYDPPARQGTIEIWLSD